jgi:uracil-DNA glycosylase
MTKGRKMHFITLDSETDFDGWRIAARTLILSDVKPSGVTWTVRGSEPELFAPIAETPPPASPQATATFNVPAKFVDLAKSAILHRDPERFAILYRLLWRLRSDHDLLEIATDPDVALVATMAKAVRRDEHKMHAFVRFREVGREQTAHYVAWFEPEHHIVELAAPFFARRFADMPWSILTPDACAHWDGHAVSITPGVGKAEAPTEDRLEETWRRYYASIFNPARLKVKAMQTEMPKKYWRNLPEASLIKPLIAGAEAATGAMIADAATDPHKAQKRPEPAMTREASKHQPDADIAALREEAAECRACPLWKDATQTVFGEGPPDARIILVGEQPGDKEDLAGKPFVGPAGQMLDRALREAGVDRTKVYVTNAVKHFKFVPRGKIRLHQKPATPEIRACRPWYERELAAIKPALVVAMGATAAQSVFGRATPINKNRGQLVELQHGIKALVTVHPSYLLRLPDADAKAREYERFVDDLRIAAGLLKKILHAA